MGSLNTRNFTIFYNDVPDGIFRAQALAQTCEYDLTRLEQFFRIPYQPDGLNRGGTRIYIISPPTGGASNKGWAGLLGSSQMDINGDFAPAAQTLQTPIIRSELVRMLFVAEMAEIFMDIAPGGWDRGGSHGEALSIILATELHPQGYYGGISNAPRVNPWLRASPRPDWVSSNEDTDTDMLSYGCGILFINYLRHQLGFDLSDIIALRPNFADIGGGYTLSERCAALTGKSASQAFPDFMALLERHLPQSRSAETTVSRDDIFPLRDAPQRSVFMSTETVQVGSRRIEPSRNYVTIKPGILCGEGEYRYWEVEDDSEVIAYASCSGYGNAGFRWTVNGTELMPSTSWAVSSIPVDITVPQPNKTTQEQPGSIASCNYRMESSWNRSSLHILNIDHNGTYQLDIRVTATEAFLGDGDTSTDRSTELPTKHFEYESNLYDDERRCNGQFEDFSTELLKLTERMRLILVAPDPQPELRIGEILEAAGRVNDRIASVAAEMGVTEQAFRQTLSRGSRMAAEVEAAQRRAFRVESAQTDDRPNRPINSNSSKTENQGGATTD
jgi:hypothetical protein